VDKFPLGLWKDTLCLQDWNINLHYVDSLEHNQWGIVRWQSSDRFAVINIARSIAEDMKYYTTMHELVHLTWFEGQEALQHFTQLLTDSREVNIVKSIHKSATEVGVNRVTKALMELAGVDYDPIGLTCESTQQGYTGTLISSPVYPLQNDITSPEDPRD
jgi:hypothetical protein